MFFFCAIAFEMILICAGLGGFPATLYAFAICCASFFCPSESLSLERVDATSDPANAFAAAAVHIVGRRRWNRRGAMVTDRYQHLVHHPDVDSLLDWAAGQGLTIVAVDEQRLSMVPTP